MKKSIIILSALCLFLACKSNQKDKLNPLKIDTTKQRNNTIISITNDSIHNIVFLTPRKIKVTDKLKKIINEPIDSVEEIDFTGDNIPDFICKAKASKSGIGNEYWISSESKIIKITQYSSDGFYYRWFVNLDNDSEPEIFEAFGDEDGIDYTIKDQNLLTGKDKLLLYINPIIIENGKNYWGYPWDISNIKVRAIGIKTEIFCSLNHKIVRDGNEENDPKLQKQMPVIFFTGHHTQESEQHDITKEQWMTLEEIIKQTKR